MEEVKRAMVGKEVVERVVSQYGQRSRGRVSEGRGKEKGRLGVAVGEGGKEEGLGFSVVGRGDGEGVKGSVDP